VRKGPAAGPQLNFARLLWEAWKAYSHRAASYQGNLLLSIIYFVILGPCITLARLFGARLLDLSTRSRTSHWIARRPTEKTLAGMERQF